MKDQPKETYIVFNDSDEYAEVTTANRKWINRLTRLVEDGHAEEIEPHVDGARSFVLPKSLIHPPFYRKPREYTKEQIEAARERLAAVRTATQETKPKKAAKAAAKPAPAPKAKKPAPVIEEELDEEEFDDLLGLDDEEEEDEEVMVRKPVKPGLNRKPKSRR